MPNIPNEIIWADQLLVKRDNPEYLQEVKKAGNGTAKYGDSPLSVARYEAINKMVNGKENLIFQATKHPAGCIIGILYPDTISNIFPYKLSDDYAKAEQILSDVTDGKITFADDNQRMQFTNLVKSYQKMKLDAASALVGANDFLVKFNNPENPTPKPVIVKINSNNIEFKDVDALVKRMQISQDSAKQLAGKLNQILEAKKYNEKYMGSSEPLRLSSTETNKEFSEAVKGLCFNDNYDLEQIPVLPTLSKVRGGKC